ncbi:Oligoxyloglucan reducing end-specific cellobiohydrolase [Collybia nuda]|uniref:Oligoxyloglucan reducing end-specific cellobiohydrolase n=1 Tax=Collybia nuda TaxID=64659 RepID=A0A9P5XWX9_9AGAR|nr:Oligoxyloglucan reducing end-specific cellobiohydrolase [Collybia nuda]
MLRLRFLAILAAAAISPLVYAVNSQSYTWKNVKIGGGGGFVPGIVFNPTEKGLAYARTDIGGAYKLNADDSWAPLLDFADDARWNYWGVDALATDPVQPARLYLATGMYTNSWDPSNGQILISTDYGKTFTASKLPFKVGGNMPGRGMGERLAVDPNSNSILFFGARSGNGLWKSTNSGVTWTKVTSFPSTGTYIPDASDSSGYNSDKVGIAWVTFDKTSGTSGTATPRIFVGVANKGASNVYVTTNGGTTWTAVTGQPTTYLPHKGVLSPSEKALYVSYSDGAGPYDGTLGAVFRYDIAAGTWKDITPVSGGDLYFGFGGVAIDLQKPGTIMVAALNSWYPDGQIYRSTNGGTTWSPFWAWGSYPQMFKYYTYSNSLAPWLGPNYVDTTPGNKQIGWMMEALVIDPFDSNHWLYGTGATVYGGRDLLKWDTAHNVTLKSIADGIEETAIQGLISPPSGPSLLSAVGDIGGFVHTSLTVAPKTGFTNPTWATAADIDFAGNKPANIVRIGTGDSTSGKQAALSTDSGATWFPHSGAADNVSGGKVAISADGTTVLWRTGSNGVQVSQNQGSFTSVSSLPATAVIASDKKSNTIFYGASGSSFYLSTDGGKTFSVKGSLGSSTSPVKVAVNPGVTGDIWVSTDKGLFHSTNSGTSFATVPGVSQAWAIALGAPAKTGGYPALFAAANIDGIGYFRSDDAGVNWVKINDAAHGFGSVSSTVLTADPRIYGRVYIGTNGRGIFYGDASGSAPPNTATGTTTATTSTTTTKPGTTTTTTSAGPTGTAPAGAYGQCGGIGWTGPTTCVTGYKCTYSNDYYSQCIPV